jgi:hypothetical protein
MHRVTAAMGCGRINLSWGLASMDFTIFPYDCRVLFGVIEAVCLVRGLRCWSEGLVLTNLARGGSDVYMEVCCIVLAYSHYLKIENMDSTSSHLGLISLYQNCRSLSLPIG